MNVNNKDSKDIEIILDEGEFDWLYSGNFSADNEEPWSNEVANSIIQKLRDAWETGKDKDGNFKLILSKEEVDFIDELIRDMLDIDFDQIDPYNEDFKGMMEVTNSILKKLGKTLLTIEKIAECPKCGFNIFSYLTRHSFEGVQRCGNCKADLDIKLENGELKRLKVIRDLKSWLRRNNLQVN